MKLLQKLKNNVNMKHHIYFNMLKNNVEADRSPDQFSKIRFAETRLTTNFAIGKLKMF